MTRKWKDNRGETLVEMLASILIGALSVALLFTAVMVSSNMDKSAERVDEAFSDSLKAAEEQTAPATIVPAGTKVTVKKAGDAAGVDVEVIFYGGDGALSYKLGP